MRDGLVVASCGRWRWMASISPVSATTVVYCFNDSSNVIAFSCLGRRAPKNPLSLIACNLPFGNVRQQSTMFFPEYSLAVEDFYIGPSTAKFCQESDNQLAPDSGPLLWSSVRVGAAYDFSMLRTAIILCSSPGARRTDAARILLASTQTN